MRKNTMKLRIFVIMLPAVHPASNFEDFEQFFVVVARGITLGYLLHGPDFDAPHLSDNSMA
jgi:hypothetical protein